MIQSLVAEQNAVNAAMKYVLANPEYKNQEEEAAYLDNLMAKAEQLSSSLNSLLELIK